jgi:hypothetical protein
MPRVRHSPRSALSALTLFALLTAFGLSACGGDDDSETESARPAPEASSFPPADGRTIDEIAEEYTPAEDLVISPAGRVFSEGRNRFGFAVFEVDRTQVTDADVAIYAAPYNGGKAQGPFPARVESLETEPAFTAETTSSDPDAAKAVYVADVIFDSPGEWRLIALVRTGADQFSVANLTEPAEVTRQSVVPEPGEAAPKVHTPTVDDVADVAEIDTRTPPSTMHDEDLADVIGKKPVVLLFATPALCTSRVCGPVVDVAEQVKRDSPDAAAYIHMEIYEDNQPSPNNLRPQVEAYNLPTEPWLFVLDCKGDVDTRIEGAFSVAELTDAVERVRDSC